MTATDKLLTLLKEHGVEHYEHEAPATDCIAFFDGRGWHDCWESVDGEVNVTFSMTPEQAIAATLGATDAKPTQAESSGTCHPFSCSCSNDCTNGERTETCKLDDFADVPFSVDYEIEDYDMDSDRDYATLAECSACGAYILVPPEYHHVLTCDGDEVYQPYRFCPNCGRRIEQ